MIKSKDCHEIMERNRDLRVTVKSLLNEISEQTVTSGGGKAIHDIQVVMKRNESAAF